MQCTLHQDLETKLHQTYFCSSLAQPFGLHTRGHMALVYINFRLPYSHHHSNLLLFHQVTTLNWWWGTTASSRLPTWSKLNFQVQWDTVLKVTCRLASFPDHETCFGNHCRRSQWTPTKKEGQFLVISISQFLSMTCLTTKYISIVVLYNY